MADLLQKVFQIHVKPYYINATGNKTFYQGTVYGDFIPSQFASTDRYPLITDVVGGTANSPAKLNQNGKFTSDPWYLHSVYTSYNAFRDALKEVIAVYGTNNARCSLYIPIDYDVLPNQ